MAYIKNCKICQFVTRPLQKDPVGLFLIYTLFSGVQIVYHTHSLFAYGVYIAIFAFLQVYVLLLLLTLSMRVYKIIKPVLIVFLVCYFSINLFCYIRLECVISPDITEAILTTNIPEVKSFFEVYFRQGDYFIFFIVAIVSYFLYNLSTKLSFCLSFYKQIAATLFLLLLTLSIIRNNAVASFYWESMQDLYFDEVTDLSLCYTNPRVSYEEKDLPEKVIVIIGESYTKTHSSLYGYPICTNPRLEALQKDSTLFVLDKVCSPATFTVPAFKYILNTHLLSDPKTEIWFKTITVIEILRTLGYSTHWCSNQGRIGKHENVSTAYSRICDTAEFYFSKGNNELYNDDILLNAEIPTEKKLAVFYHLMGQHGSFRERYPDQYDVFNSSLYKDFPMNQIEPRRTYDNATLFNDYVCSELMQKYQAEDAIVFYFPDHGQDIFDIDPDFYGHGRPGNKESTEVARQIPFMIYMSHCCQKKHPAILSRVKASLKDSLCTDAFTYFMMDILDVHLTDDNRM